MRTAPEQGRLSHPPPRSTPGPARSCHDPHPPVGCVEMRGRPRHCRATQPTPQPLPPRSGQAFPPGLHQVGLAVHLCDGRWPCVQGHHGICRGHLLRTPAPLLCSARLRQCAGLTLCRPLRRQEAEQPRQPLVWKSLCWGRVQYLSNLLLRGPLMGSIRSAWHSEALLCPWGPPGVPEILVVPREKTPTGAAAQGNP